ncbi:MAG: pyruvate dehydrogenase (acetyl-transferring) E1 component subunit alpha [Nitrospiraceae bacterium]|nr:pyruvate dehydrogenase (acetyl-transferring) E1 component subunit alpha [Nitrospiraceae bacterium]
MPEKSILSFEVKRLDVLDEEGNADVSLMPGLSGPQIKRIYEMMVLSRAFDERALRLQREGRLGTYASIRGQEAAQVASAFAAEKSDWIFPSFRETGVQIALGYPLHMLFQYWAGDERGMRCPEGLNVFPVCVPVGTHLPHAAGAAIAMKIRGEKKAALAYFGDGATSKGDFHEAFNLAGVFRAPAVFICQNNQWAISVPLSRQTAARTLAQKAMAYGFTGIQVDGNDVFAVYKASKEAIERAKHGGGPSFIECFTYRLENHTTADDSTRYRPAGEIEDWRGRDPVKRLRLYMEKEGLLNEDQQRQLERKAEKAVDLAFRKMEEIGPPPASDLFAYTFNEPSPREARQMREFLADADG